MNGCWRVEEGGRVGWVVYFIAMIFARLPLVNSRRSQSAWIPTKFGLMIQRLRQMITDLQTPNIV